MPDRAPVSINDALAEEVFLFFTYPITRLSIGIICIKPCDWLIIWLKETIYYYTIITELKFKERNVFE